MGDDGQGEEIISVDARTSAGLLHRAVCDQCAEIEGKCEHPRADAAQELKENSRQQAVRVATGLHNEKLYSDKTCQRRNLADTVLRLKEAEAILGILFALPSPDTREVLRTVGNDPFARRILARVEKNQLGPLGETHGEPLVDRYRSPGPSKSVYDDESHVNPFEVGPTNAWQNGVLNKIITARVVDGIDLDMPSSMLFSEDDAEDETGYDTDSSEEDEELGGPELDAGHVESSRRYVNNGGIWRIIS